MKFKATSNITDYVQMTKVMKGYHCKVPNSKTNSERQLSRTTFAMTHKLKATGAPGNRNARKTAVYSICIPTSKCDTKRDFKQEVVVVGCRKRVKSRRKGGGGGVLGTQTHILANKLDNHSFSAKYNEEHMDKLHLIYVNQFALCTKIKAKDK